MFLKGNDETTKSGNTATTSGVSANLIQDVASPMLAPNKEIKESSFAAAEAKKSSVVAVVAAAPPDSNKSGVAASVPLEKADSADPQLVSMADI